jgi:hypothetical protein
MILTFLAAIAVGLMAVSAFTLDIMSSPKESRWMSLPKLIRWEIRLTATVLMIWSVNLVDLSNQPAPAVGQVNLVILAALACLAVTVVSLTVYAINMKLPARAWERVAYVVRTMRQRPNQVPVMMSTTEVLEAHHAAGQAAVAGDDPAAVPKEGSRYLRAIQRSHQP